MPKIKLRQDKELNGSAWLVDFLELWLMPALSACVPERYLLPFWTFILRNTRLYRLEGLSALAGRQKKSQVVMEETWLLGFRLQRALDYGDAFRYLHWGKANNIRDEQATLILGMHWGQGMRALHTLHQTGQVVSFLSAAVRRSDYGPKLWRYWYARYRTWVTKRVGGRAVIMTGGAYEQIEKCLRDGQSVWALFDLPHYLVGACEIISIEGEHYQIPSGLLTIALTSGARVLVCHSGYDLNTGLFSADFKELHFNDVRDLATQLAQQWHFAIKEDERQWHNWQHWQKIN